MPYLLLFEAVEPLVEVLGFAIVITLIVENAVNWSYLVAFVLIAALTGAVMSAAALLIEEIGFYRYRGQGPGPADGLGPGGGVLVSSPAGVVASEGDAVRAHWPPARLGFDPGGRGGPREPPQTVAPMAIGSRARESPPTWAYFAPWAWW